MLKIDAEIRKSSSIVQPPAPLSKKLARIGKTRKRYDCLFLAAFSLLPQNDEIFSVKRATIVKCVTLEPSSSSTLIFTRVRSVTICSRQPTVPEARSARSHTSNNKTMINQKDQYGIELEPLMHVSKWPGIFYCFIVQRCNKISLKINQLTELLI